MSMSSEGAAPDPEDTLVQYIVVRSDLGKDKGWPLGSVIAQGAHAATKTLWELRESENVKEYCGNVDSMHKVVLGAKSEKQLSNSAEKLDEAGERRRSCPRTARGMNTKNRSCARAARSCCHLFVDGTLRRRTMGLSETPPTAFLNPDSALQTCGPALHCRNPGSMSRKPPRPQPLCVPNLVDHCPNHQP